MDIPLINDINGRIVSEAVKLSFLELFSGIYVWTKQVLKGGFSRLV